MQELTPIKTLKFIDTWAEFSPCKKYRYTLGRRWAEGRVLLVLSHNPSTATAEVLDATIRKDIGFARTWGFNGIVKWNLAAFRGTDPKCLNTEADPIGPKNDYWLSALLTGRFGADRSGEIGMVVAAWGSLHLTCKNPTVKTRPIHVLSGLKPYVDVYAYRITAKTKVPEHPLYIPYDTAPVLIQARNA